MSQTAVEKIIPVSIEEEMKKSYIDYAMSVIVARALPDVRDGLKPVHRRILYAMFEDSIFPNKPYKKSATTVGNVLGRYHPHGDAAVYDSLVRMAQDFSLRYPLIDGHGNFGSIDGDSAAAYRYTEARMAKISLHMLSDIEKNTVEYVPNYDDTKQEPSVLPSRIPNLLINGSSGIAVGMATNIPPHNLSEVIDAIIAKMSNNLTLFDLMKYIKGPDFPTGAQIEGTENIALAYQTGRGKIKVRAKYEIEEEKGIPKRIVYTEIPYMINKPRLLEKINDLIKEKRIEGAIVVRDESGREGLRIVVDVKKDANVAMIINRLFKFSELESVFGINLLALVDGEPKTLSLIEIIDYFIEFQRSIITRKTEFEKKAAEDRKHILEGLRIASSNIDTVIGLIRNSKNISEATILLIEEFKLSDIQAKAIVDMRLGKLSSVETEKVEEEYEGLLKTINEQKEILSNQTKLDEIIKNELVLIKEKFGDERRTEILKHTTEIQVEDLIEDCDNVITLTNSGYIKRTHADVYKSQLRGGKGVIGLKTRENDYLKIMVVAKSLSNLLFFSNKGKVYKLKAHAISESNRQAIGTPIVNLIQTQSDEKFSAIIPVAGENIEQYILMVTKNGIVKKTKLEEFSLINKNGKIAINLDDGDELIKVLLCSDEDGVMICTHKGMMLKTDGSEFRAQGRVGRGVKGIKLKDDYVVGAVISKNNSKILIITEYGYAKRIKASEFRNTKRGAIGTICYNISQKTGKVITFDEVHENEDLLVTTSSASTIRINTADVRVLGRRTTGSVLVKLKNDAKVVAIAKVQREEA